MSVSLTKPATPARVTPEGMAFAIAMRALKQRVSVVQVPMMDRHTYCAQGAACTGAGCVHTTGKTYRKRHTAA